MLATQKESPAYLSALGKMPEAKAVVHGFYENGSHQTKETISAIEMHMREVEAAGSKDV